MMQPSSTLTARQENCRAPISLPELNDAFRKSFVGGRLVPTPGVMALSDSQRSALLNSVQAFDSFDAENDPYGEHDFGAIDLSGVRYFWKIDAYDRRMEFGSPDPTDPAVTTRVLTVMRADEY